jgi:hypothetical protein
MYLWDGLEVTKVAGETDNLIQSAEEGQSSEDEEITPR